MLRIEDLAKGRLQEQKKTNLEIHPPGAEMAFPGLGRIITQATLYAKTNGLSREKLRRRDIYEVAGDAASESQLVNRKNCG